MIRVREGLAGRRIAVTGSTGFLGTALVERLLRAVPDCELVLLVRAGRRSSPSQRAQREIFRNDAFDRLRNELGGRAAFEAEVARRVTVVAGDVGRDGLGLDDDGRAALASCDLVIHSAATVAFDSPLDGAVEVNLLGPSRIVAVLHELGRRPHLVAVSTCYVAGNRRGSAPEQLLSEGPFYLELDWRAEVDAARRARVDFETASRTPEMLASFRKAARRELGAAGAPLLAEKTEQRRTAWVGDRMAEAGRSRAASVGWPDAYTFTKALGEQALAETRGDVPVSIVRPSIIESAWAEPRPGWIRGFRMAEPIIISYARGLLKQFPGVPEGIVDVIPVDLVVGAICAVAAKGPEPDRMEVVPGRLGRDQPPRLPPPRRPGAVLVSRAPAVRPRGAAHRRARLVVPGPGPGAASAQPGPHDDGAGREGAHRPAVAGPGGGVERPHRGAARGGRPGHQLRRAVRGLCRMRGALRRRPSARRYGPMWTMTGARRFAFDPRAIDWARYLQDVHLPSVVQQARVRTTGGGRTRTSRAERLRAQVLSPQRHMAAFDLENTLIASNVVASYSWLATRRLTLNDRLRFVAKTLAEAPGLLALDRRDRGDFLRHFYRRYEDAPIDQIAEDAGELLSDLIITKAFPAGDPPGARAPGPRPPHAAHHRRARLHRRADQAAVRRHRLRLAQRPARRHLLG